MQVPPVKFSRTIAVVLKIGVITRNLIIYGIQRKQFTIEIRNWD